MQFKKKRGLRISPRGTARKHGVSLGERHDTLQWPETGNRQKMMLGIDIGSTTAKLVLVKDGAVVFECYERHMLQVHFSLIVETLNAHGYRAVLLSNDGPEVSECGLRCVHNDTCCPAHPAPPGSPPDGGAFLPPGQSVSHGKRKRPPERSFFLSGASGPAGKSA